MSPVGAKRYGPNRHRGIARGGAVLVDRRTDLGSVNLDGVLAAPRVLLVSKFKLVGTGGEWLRRELNVLTGSRRIQIGNHPTACSGIGLSCDSLTACRVRGGLQLPAQGRDELLVLRSRSGMLNVVIGSHSPTSSMLAPR